MTSHTFGRAIYKLFFNNTVNKTDEDGKAEGSINLIRISSVNEWKNLSKDDYSILRFIHKDIDGNAIFKYNGEEYNDRNRYNELVNLSPKSKDRLKYSKLYIEKTVDVHADDMVEPNEEITYSIIIKNNSANDYKDDIYVKENISEYVEYKNYAIYKKNQNEENYINVNIECNMNLEQQELEWNIGKLKSQEEVKITYMVKVKDNVYGKTIESTGMVGNIPSTIVKNGIGSKLTETEENRIKEKYLELKNNYNGKELINEIYKQGLGVELNLNNFNITDLILNTTKNSISYTTIGLNEDNNFYNMILNKYWSTLYEKNYTYKDDTMVDYTQKRWKEYNNTQRRADTIYGENFETGDILIYLNQNDVQYSYDEANDEIKRIPITYENGEYVYIYIEGQGFVGVNYGNDGIVNSDGETSDDRNEFNVEYYNKRKYNNKKLQLYSDSSRNNPELLEFANYQTLFGKDYYVILRPAIALTKLEIEFEDYNEINENGKKYIENIQPKTTLEEFISEDKIKTNGTIEVIKNGEKITNSETKISTGMTLKISLNNEAIEYTIVVKGDTNGDGDSNISDIMQINKHRLKKTQLTNENFLAGDVNKNDIIDINDLMKINKYRLKKIDSL